MDLIPRPNTRAPNGFKVWSGVNGEWIKGDAPILPKISFLDIPHECIIKILESIGFIERDYYITNKKLMMWNNSDNLAYWFLYNNKWRDKGMSTYNIKNDIMPYIYTKKKLNKIDPITLCKLSMVSKQFNREFNDNTYWKLLLERDMKRGKQYKRVPKNCKSKYYKYILIKYFNIKNDSSVWKATKNRKRILNETLELLDKRKKAIIINFKIFDKHFEELANKIQIQTELMKSEYVNIPEFGTYGGLTNQLTRCQESLSLVRRFPEIEKAERMVINRQLKIVNESLLFYNPILDKLNKYIDYLSMVNKCLESHS